MDVGKRARTTALQADVGKRARPAALEPAAVAWLVTLPCAAIVVLAIALLGPPLGHALFAPGPDRFWPEAVVAPEPVEHARFLLAIAGPLLAAGALLAVVRRPPRLPAGVQRRAVGAAQLGTFAFLVLQLLAQNDILLRGERWPSWHEPLFTLPTLVAAAVFAGGAVAVLRRRTLVDTIARLAQDTRGRRVACAAIAVLLVLVWLSVSFNTEGTLNATPDSNLISWDMNETFAVLDGRTPLVDFHSQYAQLLPYLFAASLRLFGATAGAWTATLIACSGAALAAVYAILRRVAGSALLALGLFVPFLATSAFLIFGTLSPLQIFSLWPMRYGGPYLLAWLTVRALDGGRPRWRWLLFAAGGLVAINNLEFGLPALGGTLAALVWARPPRTRAAGLRLARDVALGLLAAIAVVSAIALAHGGAPPRFGLLLEFPRIYGIGGWVLEPMAPVGFHVAMYVTFAAAIVVATVRAVRGERNVALTGMLVWSGLFGLGAASYYAGRSDPLDLISLFSAWCLALVLLAVVVVGALARMQRRPALPELAVLFALGLAVASIPQIPRPWAQVARLRRASEPVFLQASAVELVKRTAQPGQKVAILIALGDRIAYDAGVVDVAPYSSSESIPTAGQMDTTLAAIRRAGVTRVYVDPRNVYRGALSALSAAGYAGIASADHYVALAPRG